MTHIKQIAWSIGIAAIITGFLYLAHVTGSDPVGAILAASVMGAALLMAALQEDNGNGN